MNVIKNKLRCSFRTVMLLAAVSSALCFSACAEPYDELSNTVTWTGEFREPQVNSYTGSDAFGMGSQVSKYLQGELEKAMDAGKQDEFIDAIMSFASVKSVKVVETDSKKHTTHSTLTLFPLEDRSRNAKGQERYRTIIANDASIYLDGQPAELQALTEGCVASFWGQDMKYQTGENGEQEIIGVTLIYALSPDDEY